MKKLNKVAVLFASAALAAPLASVAQSSATNDNWRATDGTVWKNGTNELCWRDAFWTPATAAAECDGGAEWPEGPEGGGEERGDGTAKSPGQAGQECALDGGHADRAASLDRGPVSEHLEDTEIEPDQAGRVERLCGVLPPMEDAPGHGRELRALEVHPNHAFPVDRAQGDHGGQGDDRRDPGA